MTPEQRVIQAIHNVLYDAGVPHKVIRELVAKVQVELKQIEWRQHEESQTVDNRSQTPVV